MFAAFCGGEKRETISLYLDSGNTYCTDRFEDLLNDTLAKLQDIVNEKRLILRIDSGYGSDKNIEKIKDKVKFVAKGYSTTRAFSIAQAIPNEAYEEIDRFETPTNFPTKVICAS